MPLRVMQPAYDLPATSRAHALGLDGACEGWPGCEVACHLATPWKGLAGLQRAAKSVGETEMCSGL